MGDYIGVEDLTARYRSFDTKKGYNVSSDSIYYAEKEIESILAKAYTVPFSAAHPTVKDLCIDMVYARFMRMNEPKNGNKLYDSVRDRAEKIAAGKEPLITGSGYLDQSAAGADLPESTTEDYHPTHTMLGAENEYTYVSSDRLSDLEDTRD